jgi:hypothetical protein
VLTHRTCGDPPCLPHPCQPAIPMLTRDPRKNRRIHGSRDPHPLKPIPMATGTVFWWVRVRVSKIYPWVTPVTHYRSVMRNLISLDRSPHLTRRSTKCVMWPDLLCVPSIFQMVRGFGRFNFPIFILLRSLLLMKLSVAPESMRTCLSAFECVLCKRVGICNDLYLQV